MKTENSKIKEHSQKMQTLRSKEAELYSSRRNREQENWSSLPRTHLEIIEGSVRKLFKLIRGVYKKQFPLDIINVELQSSSRLDWHQEAWAYWLSPEGKRARTLAQDQGFDIRRQENYAIKSVYRHLYSVLKLKYPDLQESGCQDRGHHKSIDSDESILTAAAFNNAKRTAFQVATEKATPDLRIYLWEKSRDEPLGDEDLKLKYGWTRAYFNSLVILAKEWVFDEYPDESRPYLNRLRNAQLVLEREAESETVRASAWEMMEDLYCKNDRQNPGCSVLFVSDDGNPILWGPLSDLVGEALHLRPNPGRLLGLVGLEPGQIDQLEKCIPVTGAVGGVQPPFWMYRNFGFSELVA